MNYQPARESALEAHVRRGRGECRFYRSDDLTQPGGPCRMEREVDGDVIAPCALCGQPCPDPHIHLYERDPAAFDQAQASLQSAAGGLVPPAAASTWAAELLTRLRELSESAGLGLCSEGCAIRYQAGEPTTAEWARARRAPYTHAFFGLLDQADHAVSPDGPTRPEPPRSKDPA